MLYCAVWVLKLHLHVVLIHWVNLLLLFFSSGVELDCLFTISQVEILCSWNSTLPKYLKLLNLTLKSPSPSPLLRQLPCIQESLAYFSTRSVSLQAIERWRNSGEPCSVLWLIYHTWEGLVAYHALQMCLAFRHTCCGG